MTLYSLANMLWPLVIIVITIQVVLPCNDSTHNAEAPNQHNRLCQRRSVLNVIHSHQDFSKSSMLIASHDVLLLNFKCIKILTLIVYFCLHFFQFLLHNLFWEPGQISFLRLQYLDFPLLLTPTYHSYNCR